MSSVSALKLIRVDVVQGSSKSPQNHITLKGKVTHKLALEYTPTGKAVCQFTVAALQTYFEQTNYGYFDVLLTGELASQMHPQLRIGKQVAVEGLLWMREYRNRRQDKVKEVLVIASQVELVSQEKA